MQILGLHLKLVESDDLSVAPASPHFKQVCQMILNAHKIRRKNAFLTSVAKPGPLPLTLCRWVFGSKTRPSIFLGYISSC